MMKNIWQRKFFYNIESLGLATAVVALILVESLGKSESDLEINTEKMVNLLRICSAQ